MKPQKLGSATVAKVFEFDQNPVPLTMMMPAVTQADLDRAEEWLDDRNFGATPEQSVLNLGWHSYLVAVDGINVLVDTGLGNGKIRPDLIAFAAGLGTDYLDRLEAAGVAPEDVDVVICTHLHFDHVGWNTRFDAGRWVPTFPNARYIFTRTDFEHFRNASAGDPLSGPAFLDSVLPVQEAGHAELVEPGFVIHESPGCRLWLESAAGHSPGSVMVRLQSGAASAVFSGDVIHHPIQLVRPEISLGTEESPEAATAVRRRLLADVADTDILLFPAHFCGASAGRVSTGAGGGYQWEPVARR